MMTAGPASGTASCMTKKMPVPTVAPTPSMVSWKVPMRRSKATGSARSAGRWASVAEAARVDPPVSLPSRARQRSGRQRARSGGPCGQRGQRGSARVSSGGRADHGCRDGADLRGGHAAASADETRARLDPRRDVRLERSAVPRPGALHGIPRLTAVRVRDERLGREAAGDRERRRDVACIAAVDTHRDDWRAKPRRARMRLPARLRSAARRPRS